MLFRVDPSFNRRAIRPYHHTWQSPHIWSTLYDEEHKQIYIHTPFPGILQAPSPPVSISQHASCVHPWEIRSSAAVGGAQKDLSLAHKLKFGNTHAKSSLIACKTHTTPRGGMAFGEQTWTHLHAILAWQHVTGYVSSRHVTYSGSSWCDYLPS